MPKYVGEGVASCGTPSTLRVPLLHYPCLFTAILGNFREHTLDAACPKCVILFAHVTSLNDAVTSYVTSQCHMCTGHVTIYYKRAANASVRGVLACCSSGSTLSPETHVWLVSNTCRSQSVEHISRWEPTSFNSNYCVSLC